MNYFVFSAQLKRLQFGFFHTVFYDEKSYFFPVLFVHVIFGTCIFSGGSLFFTMGPFLIYLLDNLFKISQLKPQCHEDVFTKLTCSTECVPIANWEPQPVFHFSAMNNLPKSNPFKLYLPSLSTIIKTSMPHLVGSSYINEQENLTSAWKYRTLSSFQLVITTPKLYYAPGRLARERFVHIVFESTSGQQGN